jgi:hypothetical protein
LLVSLLFDLILHLDGIFLISKDHETLTLYPHASALFSTSEDHDLSLDGEIAETQYCASFENDFGSTGEVYSNGHYGLLLLANPGFCAMPGSGGLAVGLTVEHGCEALVCPDSATVLDNDQMVKHNAGAKGELVGIDKGIMAHEGAVLCAAEEEQTAKQQLLSPAHKIQTTYSDPLFIHSTALPTLNITLYEALVVDLPLQSPSDYIYANASHVNNVVQELLSLTQIDKIYHARFAGSMIYRVSPSRGRSKNNLTSTLRHSV